MAVAAIRAELSVMSILGSVTGKTIRRRAFKEAIDMTCRANNILMTPRQQEFCLAMIKVDILPVAWVMATRAIFTQLTIMLIDVA